VCVQVNHHNSVGLTIAEYQMDGWELHTYQAAGIEGNILENGVNHYLLFVREIKTVHCKRKALSGEIPEEKILL